MCGSVGTVGEAIRQGLDGPIPHLRWHTKRLWNRLCKLERGLQLLRFERIDHLNVGISWLPMLWGRMGRGVEDTKGEKSRDYF